MYALASPSPLHASAIAARRCRAAPVDLVLCTFGGLALRIADGGALFASIPGRRLRQLLRWLVLSQWGPPLEVAVVCDAMWPRADGAAARSNFDSTIRRLRVLLRSPAAIVVSDGLVMLDRREFATDLDVLHRAAVRLSGLQLNPAEAVDLALSLHRLSDVDNPVLLAPPDNAHMAQRIQALGAAWRHVVLQLIPHLQAQGRTALCLPLCEQLERHGLADARVLACWQASASFMPYRTW